MSPKKQSFFKRIETKITLAASILAAISVLLIKGNEVAKFIEGIFEPKFPKCAEFEISTMPKIPYYLVNTIDRRRRPFLYWVVFSGRNKCKYNLNIEVKLTVKDTRIATIEQSNHTYTVLPQDPASEKTREDINPKFKFLRDDVDATIRVQWNIYKCDTSEIIASNPLGNPLDITVVSKKYIYWDLRYGNNEKAPLEFLLASLSAWTIDPDITNIQRIQNLLQGSQPRSSLAASDFYYQWINQCYSELFEFSVNQIIVRPYNKPWPPSGEGEESKQALRSSKEIIEGRQPDSLEAILLIATIMKSNIHIPPGSRLVFFAIPRSNTAEKGLKKFLLAWSSNDENWYAVDMTNPNQISFRENEASASIELRTLINKYNGIITALGQKGVYIGDDKGILAVDFNTAKERFQISGLPK